MTIDALESAIRAELNRQAQAAPDSAATERGALAVINPELSTHDRRPHRHWWIVVASAAVIVAIAIASVALTDKQRDHSQPATPTPSTNPSDLIGHQWQLVKVDPAAGALRSPDGRVATLEFSTATSFLAFDLCNGISGAVGINPDEGTLTFSHPISTTKGCQTPAASVIDTVFRETVRWGITEHVLMIVGPNGEKLTFAIPSTDPANLIGPAWTLTAISQSAGELPATQRQPANLVVDGTFTFKASDSCNDAQGRIDVNGAGAGTLEFQNVSLTAGYCGDVPVQLVIDATFYQTVRWGIVNNTLTLTRTDGIVLTYTRS